MHVPPPAENKFECCRVAETYLWLTPSYCHSQTTHARLYCITSGAGSPRLVLYCLPAPQGLELLHTVFVKEHNAIAAKLAATYPSLSDQQLFDKSRMITAAVIAKIHTVEWTPAILPNNNLAAAMNANWQGVVSMLSPLEAAAATGLAETIFANDKEALLGFRGGARIDWGVKYSMTEVRLFLKNSFSARACTVHS
jgi:hypothetical protein